MCIRDSLFTLTPWKGIDPEKPHGNDLYPLVKTYSIGLNIEFCLLEVGGYRFACREVEHHNVVQCHCAEARYTFVFPLEMCIRDREYPVLSSVPCQNLPVAPSPQSCSCLLYTSICHGFFSSGEYRMDAYLQWPVPQYVLAQWH